MAKVWTKEEILASFEKYDRFTFLRVIKVIYDRQTVDEKSAKGTKHTNGRGFSAYDAEFLTSIYEKGVKYGGLTPGQFAAAKKAMKKYAGQLAEVANVRETLKTYEELTPEQEAFVAKCEARFESTDYDPADDYEGPDAEDVALSRAYATSSFC